MLQQVFNFISFPCFLLTDLGLDFTDKGEAPAVDDQRVPNLGLWSMTSSMPPINEPSLVYWIQKTNGMERKRCSRTRRDQPAANKPSKPYQKNHPHSQASSLMTQLASPDPPGRLSSRRKDNLRISKVETPPSYLDSHLPKPSSHEHISLYSSAIFPSWSSSPSSPYHLSAGMSSSPPNVRHVRPISQVSLPMLNPIFDHFQQMDLGPQSSPDSLAPTSPGYHEPQHYNYELSAESMAQHPASRTIPAKGSHLGTHFDDLNGLNCSCWNEYGRQQIQFLAYPCSLTSHPPNFLTLQLALLPEQATATFSLPQTSHSLGTPPTGHTSGSYFYPNYEDRTVCTPPQNTYLLTNHSSGTDSSTTAPYYSWLLFVYLHVVNHIHAGAGMYICQCK